MKVTYLAHACFLITSKDGLRIMTDPYKTGDGISYGSVTGPADVATSSHEHGDHAEVGSIKGNPAVVKSTGITEAKGIKFKGVAAFHDEAQGAQRGKDTIMCFTVDGVRCCHTGDLGHQLSKEQIAEIGPVDLLMIPVGGFYTIDATGATAVMQALKPRATLPMHYKTEKLGYPISGIDGFLKGKKNVRRVDGSELTLDAKKLPDGEIVVLKPAML